MFFFLYNLAVILLAPVAIPYWLLRSRAKGQPWRSLPERLGYLGSLSDQTPLDSIWLHAVSVGEVLSVIPVLQQLRQRFPNSSLYVSTSTATGRELADEKLIGLVDGVFSAPLEFPWCVARVFRALRPRLLIIAETEIWPNYFFQAKRFGAEVLLINGRMSDRSAPRYRSLKWFFGPVLRQADAILTQGESDRERFIAAGAPEQTTSVGGNLKYDFDAPDAAVDELHAFLKSAAPELVVVAGSTREGEEAILASAFREASVVHPQTLFVVAPRHPQRFDEAERALPDFPIIRRSHLPVATVPSLPAVLLLDTLGELAGLYAHADVVFMGGSLNGWGGHNVLEPALSGRPVIVGPSMQNFRQITDDLLEVGGLLQVDSADELSVALKRLLGNPDQRATLGENGRRLAESKRGATKRCIDQAEKLFNRALLRCPPHFGRWVALRLPSSLWGLAIRLHRQLYERGILRRKKLRSPVICVGNMTVGGVGKTPTVAWLVEQLARANRNPAMLTRGYGRDNATAIEILQPGQAIDPRKIGDEPALLATRFQATAPAALIGIGADRFNVGTRLESSSKTDVFVLDDGFQHWRLARDLDIVLIDTTQPLIDDHVLPLGRLREPISGLKRADVILLTRTKPERHYSRLIAEIRRWNSSAPVFRSRTMASHLTSADRRQRFPLDHLVGKPVVAFCGLGNRGAFWRQLSDLNSEAASRVPFPDHHRYINEDIDRINAKARTVAAEAIVTTAKDLMNLDAAHKFELPIYALEIELQVDEPDELLSIVTNL